MRCATRGVRVVRAAWVSPRPMLALRPIRPFSGMAAAAGGAINPMQAKRGPKKAERKIERSAGSASAALLRSVVPERKASSSLLYDPPYPRNPLGERGVPAIELYKAIKAAGSDPVEVSKQLTSFQNLIDTDTDIRNMILTSSSAGTPRLPASGGANFPFMQKNAPTGAAARVPDLSSGSVSGLLASRAQRDVKFEAAFAKLKLSKPVATFIKQLYAQKGALLDLKRLQQLFDELALYERNEVLVRLRTAEPLKPEQLKKLQTKLKGASQGQKIVFKEEVVPSLLGGLVVFYGNKKQDLSAVARVRSLQKLLAAQA